MRYLTPIIAAACAALAGCGSAPAKHQDCSCGSYLPASPRPAWVAAEGIEGDSYRSQGVAECTGIQSQDFKQADEAARTALGRMINTQVSSEVLSIRGDYGPNAGFRKDQVRSLQVSEAALANSRIFARWLDPDTCVIYSGVQIGKADITNAIRKLEEKERNRLANQLFTVSASGAEQEALERRLRAVLNRAGAQRVQSEAADGVFRFKGELVATTWQKNDTLVRAEVSLQVLDPQGAVLWSRETSGKGVSFGGVARSTLVEKAIDDALDNGLEELQKALDGQIPQH